MAENPKLDKLKTLISLVNDGLTKKDFTEAFQAVITYLKQRDTQIASDIKTIDKALNDKIDAAVAAIKDGEDGEDGEDGRDGKDARAPITISETPPLNPQPGDLWYQP